jgi:hypothetical protein
MERRRAGSRPSPVASANDKESPFRFQYAATRVSGLLTDQINAFRQPE